MLTCVALQPLDLVKTRLQQHPTTVSSSGKILSGSLWRTTKSVVALDGLQGLWRGTIPTITRNVPGSAMYFMSFEYFRKLLNATGLVSTQASNMVSGAVARGTLGFMLMPVSVIKVRYESSHYRYQSMREASRDILAKEGVRGLFAGYGATALRDIPQAGLYVLFYEEMKIIAQSSSALLNVQVPTTAVNFGSGVVAGLSATVITQPLDLVKTRIQVSPAVYTNLPRATLKILKEEGVPGFFTGMAPRLLRKTLNSALTWTVYEEIVRLLK
ncbi:hypothetical protein RI367_002048 [Sorochytrium milnesiophthora]